MDRIVGMLPGALIRRMTARYPRSSHDGIELIVADLGRAHMAVRFFGRTAEALATAASSAPQTYAKLLQDIRQVVLWYGDPVPSYNRFQLAAIVSSAVVFEADRTCYAAWLLYTSGRSRGEAYSQERAESLLRSLLPAERGRVSEWLADTVKQEDALARVYRPAVDLSERSCLWEPNVLIAQSGTISKKKSKFEKAKPVSGCTFKHQDRSRRS